jgi:broad specificity phosphatase PhoE
LDAQRPATSSPGDILLARHGQTADNADGRILGRRDPPLTAVGVDQAHRLAADVRELAVAAVWTSPLLRARATAEIAGAAVGLAPRMLEDLVESARGTWEGRPVRELAHEQPELHAAFVRGDPEFAFPGGESLRSQAERTSRALVVVARGPLPALVVAHAGTIRAALRLWGREVPPESALAHGAVVARLRVGEPRAGGPVGGPGGSVTRAEEQVPRGHRAS